MADTSTPNEDYIRGLIAEKRGYEIVGRDDRAKEVAAELARIKGEKPQARAKKR